MQRATPPECSFLLIIHKRGVSRYPLTKGFRALSNRIVEKRRIRSEGLDPLHTAEKCKLLKVIVQAGTPSSWFLSGCAIARVTNRACWLIESVQIGQGHIL